MRRYVHGLGGDVPLVWYNGATVTSSSRSYLYADNHGSISAITGSAGNTTNINTYDICGNPNSANVGTFQYTGQMYMPQLGLYYYRARYYSPVLGRFLQSDPIGYKDDLDLYTYVGNDPLDKMDPTGEICILGFGDTCKASMFHFVNDVNGLLFGDSDAMTASLDASAARATLAAAAPKPAQDPGTEADHYSVPHEEAKNVVEKVADATTNTVNAAADGILDKAGTVADIGSSALQGQALLFSGAKIDAFEDHQSVIVTGDHKYPMFDGYTWHGKDFEEAYANRIHDLIHGNN
jgi:RHS repeat-associated protein